MLGFSDVPVTIPADAKSFHGCIEAKYVTEYLDYYVDRHVFNERSLRSRILLGYRVTKVEKIKDEWIVRAEDHQHAVHEIKSPKLVVAAGLTSTPHIPAILQQQTKVFDGPVYHHKDFGEISRTLLSTSECKSVAVIGAGKSATDMVYESVKRGKNVSWIIRKNGEGPALFFPAPSSSARYQNSTEAGATRWNALFSPSSFMPTQGMLLKLLHWTRFGINYLRENIHQTDQSCRDIAAYLNRQGASPTFKHLEPTTSAFWCTGPLGLVQHDDFWDTLAQAVRVYRNDIRSLKKSTIVLDDGSEIAADILLCGTGWRTEYLFFSTDQARSLGLPCPLSPDDSDPYDPQFDEKAKKQVLSNFPILEYAPPHIPPKTPTTLLRLYNGIAPLDDPSIVFLGRVHLSNAFRTSEAQAIWATAYFDGNIKMPPRQQAQQSIAYMNAMSSKRYPSRGAAGDNLFFELIWYTDWLLEEIGLRSHRKGWWADWVEPCLAEDFKGLLGEYVDRRYIIAPITNIVAILPCLTCFYSDKAYSGRQNHHNNDNLAEDPPKRFTNSFPSVGAPVFYTADTRNDPESRRREAYHQRSQFQGTPAIGKWDVLVSYQLNGRFRCLWSSWYD
ncbi:MAG: hypothetical protein Q9168_003099 [Polycauliona sp. 1 TL-2023]